MPLRISTNQGFFLNAQIRISLNTFCFVCVLVSAGPAIPTSNSYSKKTQSNNAENKRPDEERESGRKSSSTVRVPPSPLSGLERKRTTPTPSTVRSLNVLVFQHFILTIFGVIFQATPCESLFFKCPCI